MSPQPKPFSMPKRESADYVGVSTDTLINAVNRGELDAHKVGSKWVFLTEELERWMRGQPKARDYTEGTS